MSRKVVIGYVILGIVIFFVVSNWCSYLMKVHELKKLPSVQDAQLYFDSYKQKNPVPNNCSIHGPIDTNDWKQRAKVYTFVYDCEKPISPDSKLKELDLRYLFVVCSSGDSGTEFDINWIYENMLPYEQVKKEGFQLKRVVCSSKGPI